MRRRPERHGRNWATERKTAGKKKEKEWEEVARCRTVGLGTGGPFTIHDTCISACAAPMPTPVRAPSPQLDLTHSLPEEV